MGVLRKRKDTKMPHTQTQYRRAAEPLLTVQQAARALELPAWKLCRAVAAGNIPIYFVANTRRLVRLSEVVDAIEATRMGGADV